MNGTKGWISDIVTFESEGDFSPTIIISHYSTFDYKIQGYPDYKVHVISAESAKQAQDEQITMGTNSLNIYLAYAFLAFAIIEGLCLIWDHKPKNDEQEIDLEINGLTIDSNALVNHDIVKIGKQPNAQEEKSNNTQPFWKKKMINKIKRRRK